MNVVLIGYRGTGKSTVGKILGETLDWPVVSTDAEIVRRIGCTIPEFVAREGWDRFRDVESEVCRDCAGRDRSVIDAGGGVVVRDENVAGLRRNGRIFWLTARPETIAERIKDDRQRPSLTGTKSFLEEIREVLDQRMPLYMAAADDVIEADDRPPGEVAAEILGLLESMNDEL